MHRAEPVVEAHKNEGENTTKMNIEGKSDTSDDVIKGECITVNWLDSFPTIFQEV